MIIKEAYKEAANEFLNDKFALFGKWSLGALAALGLTALVYFILSMSGWHK